MRKLFLSSIAFSALLSASTISLNEKENHSLALAQEWIKKDIKSYEGKDGSVNFIYGSTMPSIVTAPLRITDIQLEEGEYIKDVQVGDVVRWQLSASVSGSGDNIVSHVIVKPISPNLETTLLIATDKRTYHLNLISKKKDYMPIVGFSYVSDMKKSLAIYNEKKDALQKSKTFEIVGGETPILGDIDTLNFDYRLSGDNPSWKPIRVYNDGVKTYVQMPKIMVFNEAPILMVLDTNNNQQIVNYRLLEDRFIVDKLFDKAVLFMDIGDDRQSVVIENKSPIMSAKDKSDNELKALTSGKPNEAMDKLTGVKR
jgi:type IV secretion system protein TrbG